MIISYYIPEDGDSPDHPNFFVCDSNSLTIGQLKKIFPVPGEYHFRFKRQIGSTSVWMDATNDTASVPIDSNGNVFSKVSRLTLKGVSVPVVSSVASKGVTQSQEIFVPTSPQSEVQKPPSQPVEKTRERRNSDKLLSFDNFDDPSPSPAAPAAAFGDFLDLSASVPSTTTQSNKPVDFFGFDDLSKNSNSIPNPAMLSSSVPRSTSGSSLAYPPASSGTSSPMSMGRPMGGMGMAAPQGGGMGMAQPQGGAMGMQRGGGNMTFDPFANMTPTQQQQQYRQGGRR